MTTRTTQTAPTTQTETAPGAVSADEQTRCAAETAAEFAAILGECADGIAVLNCEYRFLFVNQAGLRLLKRTAREVIGEMVTEAAPHFIGAEAAYEIRRAQSEKVTSVLETRIDDTEDWFEIRCCPNNDTLILFFYDISARKALEAEREKRLINATERSERDSLTGLWNRRAFDARLASEIERARRDNLTLAVAVMDLDNFKFFNDAYGHLSGDDALQKLSAAILSCCRSYDIAARLGGDEFALLMPGMATGDIPDLYARLALAVDAVEFTPKGYAVPIPLSLAVGVAVLPDDAWTVDDLLLFADERLARDKAGERDGGASPDDATIRALFKGDKDLAMLDALVTAVDNKDRYTRRHSLDVMTYSLLIAEELGLDAKDARSLQIAALLHDVGKIGVSDRVLRLPTRLSDDEYNAIKLHPMMGAAIVGAVAGLTHLLPAIRHHHEAWDGTGYPDNLAGEAIPLWARILAVADAYSAMTTNRPYRRSLGPLAAALIIESGSGTQWDPACVQAFGRAFRKANPDIFFKR